MLNQVSVAGRLTIAPELRKTPSGVSCCTFRIAVDRDYTAENGERPTDFLTVVSWRSTAEFVGKYFDKGDSIIVTGRLQSRSWKDDDGKTRYATEIQAEQVYFGGPKREKAGQEPQQKPASQPTDSMQNPHPMQDSLDELPF